jgi:hypothetical protein
MISNTKTKQLKGNGGDPPQIVEEKNDELLKNNVNHISLKKLRNIHNNNFKLT